MRVLATTDLSDAADLALRQAVDIASAANDPLAVVHVLLPLQRESMFFPARDQAMDEKATVTLERARVAMETRVRAVMPPRTEIFLAEGIDYAAIVRKATEWEADVIVVGSHGHSGLSRILGGVATKVAAHAPCSVLIARHGTASGCVVAATDLSPGSLLAVGAAAREARRRRARLEIVHATPFIELEISYLMQITPAVPKTAPAPTRMPDEVREVLARAEVTATWHELDGPQVNAILRHADAVDAELVVLGAHGSTALPRMSIGHVAEKVARASSRSVLIVRARET